MPEQRAAAQDGAEGGGASKLEHIAARATCSGEWLYESIVIATVGQDGFSLHFGRSASATGLGRFE
nr:hypothetical protein [Burkholderia ambifaria]